MAEQYDALAAVYDLLVPEPLRTPEGAAAAFAEHVEGERVLDCARGTGQLAVGLALLGHRVAASDASPAMVARARALAAARGVDVPVEARRWEDLQDADFDTVLCVGNSLAHADDRPAALRGMRRALREGGRLLVTTRDWERQPPSQPGYTWEGDSVLIEVGGVVQRLTFHPFTRAQLRVDLQASGFEVDSIGEGERYLAIAWAR